MWFKFGLLVLINVVVTVTFWLYGQMNSTVMHPTPIPPVFLPKLGLLQSPGPIHKNWIIVTSINPPTEQIKKLSQIPEWKLLVVADKKTPTNWNHSNAIFLDTEAQLDLGYQVLQFIPWNSYTRKMIGYLYAIQHGAEFIYDTDDDNAPNNPDTLKNDFVFDRVTRGLILNHNDSVVVVNPYIHFGQPSIWPRGFPLEYIGQDYNNTYTVCQFNTPLIQQGVVNGDPDVDAIFRLTRRKLVTPLDIQFDSAAPPVIYPTRVLAPFNSQNTIFHYDGFWALVLPVSVKFRVTDIWRGYWAQPLLWTIGGHLGFYSTNTTQSRNPHVYLRDFDEEDQLYKLAGDLVMFLANWRCMSDDDLYKCMIQLTSAMADRKMWLTNEIQLMAAWIHDLKTIGYKVPSIKQRSENDTSLCSQGKAKSFAMFNPVEMQSIFVDKFRGPLRKFCNSTAYPQPRNGNQTNGNQTIGNQTNGNQTIGNKTNGNQTIGNQTNGNQTIENHTNRNHTVGNQTNGNQTNEIRPTVFPSTLLVVTFNFPHYENIWLLDLVYRPHYPNIVYCGFLTNFNILYKLQTSREFLDANVKKFSFVHSNVAGGGLAYDCALKAIDMKYNVKGYIVLSDDILFNFWNSWQFNPDQPWLQRPISSMLNTKLPKNQTTWQHWGVEYGCSAITLVLSDMYNESSQLDPLVDQFRRNRELYGYNSSMAMMGESDFFYFPVSMQDMLYEVGSILVKRGVWLEIAVLFLITGLTPPKDIVYMSGFHAGSVDPFDHGNVAITIRHPFKLSQVTGRVSTQRKTLYCQRYVAKVLELDVV